jgi:hypothetical protein
MLKLMIIAAATLVALSVSTTAQASCANPLRTIGAPGVSADTGLLGPQTEVHVAGATGCALVVGAPKLVWGKWDL